MCELKVSHIYTDQEYRPCSVVVYLLLYTVYWAHTVYILTFLSLHSRADIIDLYILGVFGWIELWCGMVWCGVVWALVSECQCVCTHECACCLWMAVSERCQMPMAILYLGRSETAAACLKPHSLPRHWAPHHTTPHHTTPLRGLLKPGSKTHSRVS